MHKRRSGVLLHISSLPGEFGIGDLGPEANNFLSFLADIGASVWQILPLTPTGYGNSPYNSYSAFAGNELFISPERLKEEGFLDADHSLEKYHQIGKERVDYEEVTVKKWQMLLAAHRFFQQNRQRKITPSFMGSKEVSDVSIEVAVDEDFEAFRNHDKIKYWLEDYILFRAIKNFLKGQDWHEWPLDYRNRVEDFLEQWKKDHAEELELYRFAQYLFFRQWMSLKKEAEDKGIKILGDIPIFVSHDSADVWSHRELFSLDAQGKAKTVAGVPPDYFSETGQRWGNPLYDWKALKDENYSWWIERFRTSNWLNDWLRIDHFRGFASFWEIKASEKTAVNGRWKKGPGMAFFQEIRKELGDIPIIAEDLGVVTPEVESLRDKNGFPGMKILHFAFGGDADNFYLPHNHIQASVVYTGTHDNDTTLGWYTQSGSTVQQHVRDYLGIDASAISYQLLRTLMQSVANTAIFPIQDLMNLDSSHRLNTPGTSEGNWEWRMQWSYLPEGSVNYIRQLNRLTDRIVG